HPSHAPLLYFSSFPTRRSSDLHVLRHLLRDGGGADRPPSLPDILEVGDNGAGDTLEIDTGVRVVILILRRDKRLLDDIGDGLDRSEEHTSELQSRENLVCRLLL